MIWCYRWPYNGLNLRLFIWPMTLWPWSSPYWLAPLQLALTHDLHVNNMLDLWQWPWDLTLTWRPVMLIDVNDIWPWSIPLPYDLDRYHWPMTLIDVNDLDPLTCVSVLWRSRVVSLPCPSSVCVYTPSMHSTPVAEVSSRVWPWRDRSVTAAGGRGYTTPRSDAVDSTGKNTTFLLCLKHFFFKRWHAKKKQL